MTEREKELLYWLQAALEWIDAVPSDTQLPAMPGFDRDVVDSLIDDIKLESISQNEDISNLSEDELSKEIQSICAKAQRDAMIKIEPYNKALYEIEAKKTPAQKYKEMMEIHRLTQELKS